MSYGSNFQTFSKIVPPERGAFPLDLDAECGNIVKDYIACVKASNGQASSCRHLSKLYLQCRMDRGLMERDDLNNLGFRDEPSTSSSISESKENSNATTPPKKS